jgi:PhzF family phenazine biosynthesis protein
MRLPIHQIDAFADAVFAGNPAAVVPLDAWLDDSLMQAIAAENNVAETAFFVPDGDEWRLRWFTPEVEVDLCGHATLASAWLISERLQPGRASMRFHTRSGALDVTRAGELLTLDFPARAPLACAPPPTLAAALGKAPREIMAARDYFCVFASEDDVRALAPDMAALAALDKFAVIVTAPGDGCDFVSRFFAPAQGIAEDPVTGSAHCTLIPYWAKRLRKTRLEARQISKRGGVLTCEDRGARVGISGRCAPYLEGTISV